ncbi:MAG: hypothetical protein ACW987_20895 [Candidatus Thorarchaeota archaeon]|jgi:hypothetical protein
MDYKEIVKNKRTRKKLIATSAVLSLSSIPIIVLAMLQDNLVFVILGSGLLVAAVGIYFFYMFCLVMYVRGKRKEIIEDSPRGQYRTLEGEAESETDRPIFVVGQSLTFLVSFRVIFTVFGFVFVYMSWLMLSAEKVTPFTSVFAAGYALVAATIFLFILLIPHGRADVYEDRIQLFSLRLFGLVKREAGTIAFEDVNRVECFRTWVTIGVKQTRILIQLQRWNQSFDATYSIEDRRKLATVFREKSLEHGFEFLDEAGLLG